MKTYSGVGCLYGAPCDSDGVKTGNYRRLGNGYPFALQVATEQKKQISRECDRAGQVLASRTQVSEITGSLVLRQWDAKNLAWALSGEATALSGSAGSISDEVVTASPVGEFAELANENVSSVVVKDVTDTTTYVEYEDYNINLVLGMIEIVSNGSITAADVLHISYDFAAESGYEVKLGTVAQVRVALRGSFKNEYDNTTFTMEFYAVVLASSAEINFISDPDSDYEEIPFALTFETPTGKTTPGLINGMAL